MKVLSAHLWEKGKDVSSMPISLVLQQAQVGNKLVMLACVCEGKNSGEIGVTESGYFSEGLTEWFHREAIRLCERKEEEKAAGSLHMEIGRLQKENQNYTGKRGVESKLHYWGIFLVEDKAWIFSRGECKGLLLNRRFQKKNLREIRMPEILDNSHWFPVKLQKKIGILLCTEEFLPCLAGGECLDVLIPDGEITEERMEKRLQELWRELLTKGENMKTGVIYLRT